MNSLPWLITTKKKLPVVIARCLIPLGQGRPGDYGMVFPILFRVLFLGKPITVYGDGTQTRSFTHVKDVVKGLIKLMEEPKAEGDVFNVGNDHEISIKDLAMKVKEMTKSPSQIEFIPL